MTLIKICGVKSIEEGREAARLGADYIGILFHKASKRYVDKQLATRIAEGVIDEGKIPVAVFYKELETEILEAVIGTPICTIQTYEKVSLPKEYRQLHANRKEGMALPENDFFLIDSPNPGTGQVIDTHMVPQKINRPFFLAGGLSVDNVINKIEEFHPQGVDVSSGVESEGRKDMHKIKLFITRVRDYDKTIR